MTAAGARARRTVPTSWLEPHRPPACRLRLQEDRPWWCSAVRPCRAAREVPQGCEGHRSEGGGPEQLAPCTTAAQRGWPLGAQALVAVRPSPSSSTRHCAGVCQTLRKALARCFDLTHAATGPSGRAAIHRAADQLSAITCDGLSNRTATAGPGRQGRDDRAGSGSSASGAWRTRPTRRAVRSSTPTTRRCCVRAGRSAVPDVPPRGRHARPGGPPGRRGGARPLSRPRSSRRPRAGPCRARGSTRGGAGGCPPCVGVRPPRAPRGRGRGR